MGIVRKSESHKTFRDSNYSYKTWKVPVCQASAANIAVFQAGPFLSAKVGGIRHHSSVKNAWRIGIPTAMANFRSGSEARMTERYTAQQGYVHHDR